MKTIIKNILPAFIAMILFTGCEDKLAEPVADFRILDASAIEEMDINNLPLGEGLIFENTGTGNFLVLWPGDSGSVYMDPPMELAVDTSTRSYKGPDGTKEDYIDYRIGSVTNLGIPVSVKTGQQSYTYQSAGTQGDTTYTVTWIATNTDVHGNTISDMKQVTVRVTE